MTDKCAVCNVPIDVIFLEKIRGTYLKDKKGKQKAICGNCQKKFSVAELREKI